MPSTISESRIQASVQITAQGRLLKVKCFNPDHEFRGRGKRGNVETFSKQSRMRMLRMLARLHPPAIEGFRHRCVFVTLTSREIFHPRKAKEYLRAFFKRLEVKFQNVSGVWRLEYQNRGAPHFHLILYNVSFIDKLWIQEIWGEIIKQERPFTRIESIKSYKHLVNYVSKYAGKVDVVGFNIGAYLADNPGSAYGSLSAGRVWGWFKRDKLPLAREEIETFGQNFAWYSLRKYCMAQWPWIWEAENSGFTVFCDDPYHSMQHLLNMYRVFDKYAMTI